jgi:hypothetical protein
MRRLWVHREQARSYRGNAAIAESQAQKNRLKRRVFYWLTEDHSSMLPIGCGVEATVHVHDFTADAGAYRRNLSFLLVPNSRNKADS